MKLLLRLIVASLFLTNATAQTHSIEVHPNGRVASLLMTPAEYGKWINDDDFNENSIRQALIQDIYQKFEDQFDFIFLVLNEDTRPSNLPFGKLIQVSNAISGIGLSNFNNSADYGSSGKLQAVIHLTRLNYLRSGPSLHELMHNWGNFGIPTEAVSSIGSDLTSFNYKPHWGFTGGSSKGQLGGFDQSTLSDNGGGSYTVGTFGNNANGGNSIPYNELELYLMGMIPLSDVSNFDVFTAITSLIDNGNKTFTFDASKKTTYTSTTLASLLGNRVPSFATSQKNFRALVMVLTDSALTTAEWNQVDSDAEKFSRTSSDGSSSYNFWEATDQKGTLQLGNLQDVVGLETIDFSSKIRVFPNPTTGLINIDYSGLNIESFSLYSSFGQKITTLEMNRNGSLLNIDLSNYSSGIFFLHFKSEVGHLSVKKIVVH
jgi:Secretion system C-terminal sorting domain